MLQKKKKRGYGSILFNPSGQNDKQREHNLSTWQMSYKTSLKCQLILNLRAPRRIKRASYSRTPAERNAKLRKSPSPWDYLKPVSYNGTTLTCALFDAHQVLFLSLQGLMMNITSSIYDQRSFSLQQFRREKDLPETIRSQTKRSGAISLIESCFWLLQHPFCCCSNGDSLLVSLNYRYIHVLEYWTVTHNKTIINENHCRSITFS